jgi:HK97 gp10 family phage protein
MPAFKHHLGSSTSWGGDVNPNAMTGLPELDATLNKFPIRLRKIMARKGMKAAAEPVLSLAKSLVPVDSGKLRDKMRIYSARLGKKQRRVAVGASVSWPKSKTSPGKYAAAVELGTKNQPAQPFLRPAVKAAAPMVKQIFKREMARLVTETAIKVRPKNVS